MSPQGNADPAFMNGALSGATTTLSSSSTTTSTSISSRPPSSTTTAAATSSSSSSHNLGNVESVYIYNPSVAGAIAFAILYIFQAIYHFYLSVYLPHIRKSVTNKHNYTIPLFIAALLLTLGFSVRITSVSSEAGRASITLYAVSTCSVIIAPIFICATMYLTLAHLIRLCLPHGSSEQNFFGLSPKWLGRMFIASDVLSFLLQGAGSAIGTSGGWTGTRRTTGERLLVNGLAAQLGTFTVFMVVMGLFCVRVGAGKNKRKRDRDPGAHGVRGGVIDGLDAVEDTNNRREFGFNPLVKQVVKGMWIAAVLIEVRSIYRIVEFGMGTNGYLFGHEWPLWMFDAAPIWLALLVLGIYHPTTWLQQKRRSAFLHEK